jgi:hypothetical protein
MIHPDQLKKIGRAATHCLACGINLHEVTRHPSAIRDSALVGTAHGDDEDDASLFQREDFCPQCWAEMGRDGYLSFWLARREPPKIAARLTRRRRNETLLAYFVRLHAAIERAEGGDRAGVSAGPETGSELGDAIEPEAPIEPLDRIEGIERKRDRDAELRVRHYIIAHLLHYYHVLEWVAERPNPRSAKRPLLRFHAPALERDFDVETFPAEPAAIEAVQNELKHYLETSVNLLMGAG